MLRLKVTCNGRPDSGGDLIICRRFIRHPASLEDARRDARGHFVHPQRPRHQREHPSVMNGGKDERGRQALLTQLLQGVEDEVEPRLVGLDNTVPLVVRALRDQAPGVGREEVVVVPQVEPLGVPPGVVRRQSHRDVLARLLRLAGLQHQVEASGPDRLPHTYGPARGVEELTTVQVKPQLLVQHHPEEALTHRSKNRHGGDGIWRKMLKLYAVVVAERPHEAARRRAQAMAVELGEGNHIALGRPWFPVVRRRSDPLWPRRRSTGAQESFLLGCARVRWQGGRNKGKGERRKKRRRRDPRIFIDGDPPTDRSDEYGNSPSKCAA